MRSLSQEQLRELIATIPTLMAPIDNNGNTLLMIAANQDYQGLVRKLLNFNLTIADINLKNKKGMTALDLATSNQNLIIVKSLLEAGADPNLVNGRGRTPLISTVMDRDCKSAIVKALLEGGADPNIKNDEGNTVLHFASYARCFDIVKILLEHGANMNLRNEDGITAAEVGTTHEIENLLGKYLVLHTVTARNRKKPNKGSCPICMENFVAGDKQVLLHKKSRPGKTPHVFHEKCINSWLRVHDSCPLCRGSDLAFGYSL